MLHMEIVQERLEREYNLNLITTAPSVVYEVLKNDGDVIKVDNPAELPEPGFINELREPIINARILMPPDYVGRSEEHTSELQALMRISHAVFGMKKIHSH